MEDVLKEYENPIEPCRTKITSMLARQGVMLEELKRVVPLLDQRDARKNLSNIVIEENILNRPSLSSRKEVDKKLSERYFRRDQSHASAAFLEVTESTTDPAVFALLAYAMFLWNDGLTFLLGVEWLSPKLRLDHFEVETKDILRELEFIAQSHKQVLDWSDVTRKRVARHYLSLLRDCGFAYGTAKKVLQRPYIPEEVILFGSKLIIGGGEPAKSVPGHELFKAMGLEVDDVIEKLYELDHDGQLRFATQGGIVEIKFQNKEEFG